jgi:hypothetical protein
MEPKTMILSNILQLIQITEDNWTLGVAKGLGKLAVHAIKDPIKTAGVVGTGALATHGVKTLHDAGAHSQHNTSNTHVDTNKTTPSKSTWATDEKGNVKGTKLNPSAYKQHLVTKFGQSRADAAETRVRG